MTGLAARRLAEIETVWRAAAAYVAEHPRRDQVRWRIDLLARPQDGPDEPMTGTTSAVVTWKWVMGVKIEVWFTSPRRGKNAVRTEVRVLQHKSFEGFEHVMNGLREAFAPGAARVEESAAAAQGRGEAT